MSEIVATSGLSREEKLALIARLARQKERAARAFPLSFAQQRLWFLDQLEPGSPLYNIPAALRVEGPLDAGVLARCLGEIERRHESLRTVFAAPGTASAVPGAYRPQGGFGRRVAQ